MFIAMEKVFVVLEQLFGEKHLPADGAPAEQHYS